MRGYACWSGFLCLATVVLGSGCGSDASPDGTDETMATPGAGGTGSGGAGDLSGTAGTVLSGGSGAAGTGTSGKSGGGGQGGATVGTGGSAGTGGNAGTGGRAGSGGAGGQAGAGGSGGVMIPHATGKCDGLGAVGQWENITPPNIKLEPPYTGPITVLENPQTSGTLYTGTARSGVFKSTDCGATWTKTNTGRNGARLDTGNIWSAVIDPVAPKTLYALTGYGDAGLWKTTNGGVDWDQILPSGTGMPGFVARVTMDPTNHLHVIINFHDNCTGGHTPVCIGESKDGGATWKVLDFPRRSKMVGRGHLGHATRREALDLRVLGALLHCRRRSDLEDGRAMARQSRGHFFGRKPAPTMSAREMAF